MSTTKEWQKRAIEHLEKSLNPIPHELNELDWKADISDNRKRLAEHISAFSNQSGGGFFVYGISQDGNIIGVEENSVKAIIEKLSNIARDGIEPSQKVDHAIIKYNGKSLLIMHILESSDKPVHLRSKGMECSFIRTGGQTRKMSKQEMAHSVISSRSFRYEELEALTCNESEIFELLNTDKIFDFLGISIPETDQSKIDLLINNKLVYRNNENYFITNLGAIIGANDFRRFPGKERFTVRIITYKGISRVSVASEKEFVGGYGVSFQDIVKFAMEQLPTNEVIQDAIRRDVPIYPVDTVRELVANALVHRDFTKSTTHPMIEIFEDRMEILNPGGLVSSMDVNRIIDTAPESRNELFARMMRRMGICEERGTGIDKALFAVEFYQLPPLEFLNSPNSFKAIIYSPKVFKDMTSTERVRACYQHSCLKYVFKKQMTNATFRQRLGLKDGQNALVWKIICKTIDMGLIKNGNLESKSRKFTYYIPYWV